MFTLSPGLLISVRNAGESILFILPIALRRPRGDEKMKMLEIGKHHRLTKNELENHLVGVFMKMGRMSKGRHTENTLDKDGEPITSLMTLYHVHLDEDVAKEVMDPGDFDLLKDDGDFEMHIATWESGVGWIVDYTGIRKLMIKIARADAEPQPCVNCDVYKEQVEKVGKDHWAVNKTCQDCICGNDGWPNFTMEIQEE